MDCLSDVCVCGQYLPYVRPRGWLRVYFGCRFLAQIYEIALLAVGFHGEAACARWPWNIPARNNRYSEVLSLSVSSERTTLSSEKRIERVTVRYPGRGWRPWTAGMGLPVPGQVWVSAPVGFRELERPHSHGCSVVFDKWAWLACEEMVGGFFHPFGKVCERQLLAKVDLALRGTDTLGVDHGIASVER